MDSDHFPDDRIARLAAEARSGGVPEAAELSFDGIGPLLEHRAATQPHKPWMIFYADPETRSACTYGQFLERARRTAHLLHRSGVRRGDAVATMAFNHEETVVQYFAAWLLGAAVVPVNAGEDDKRISFILDDAGVKLIFVRTPFIERFEAIRAGLPGLETAIEAGEEPTGRYPAYKDAVAASDPGFLPPDPPRAGDDALIVYTSGTTGYPKGVVLTQRNLLADAKGIAEWHGIDAESRMMCVLPIHHVNGTVVTLLTPMIAGGSVVLNQKFHTEKFFARIAAEGVQVASVVPTLLQYLLHEKIDHRRFDLSRFRHIICGAGPLTCELAGRFESAFGIPIIHGYGLSETTCYSCFLPTGLTPEEHRFWLLEQGFPSIGVPIPQNEMDIHDERGVPAGEGARGEIVIRGANVMKCYFRNPAANASAFAHGWFRSGDEGFYRTDAAGRKFFFITGRIKELIIRGGVNIAPLEIDEVINSCPGVIAGIAVGFENDWYGEEVGALVMKSDPSLTEEAVIRHCRKTLPFAKSPKAVLFSDAIPVTSTGKYQRNKVRELFLAWKETQFK